MNCYRSHCICLAIVFLMLALPPITVQGHCGHALLHPVSVIEADIYVTKFKTTMRLRCFAEDLELLQGVEALDDGFYDSEELREATVDHADFLAEKIQLLDVKGNAIPAKVIEINDFEMPDEGIRQGELMKYTIGIVLEFSYDKPPDFLTINQQIVAEGLLLPSELKILLKQEGSDEPYFHMMKPDQPETFRFDWTKPIPKSDASEQEWSSWFDEQREQTLGIASYSSVYSFIYITNFEVRHEVLIPLATLSTFFEIERADESFLDIPEQDTTAEKIKALFSVGNPVFIDNVEVQPVFDRIDFYGLDLRDFAVRADRRRVSMANGRVGIIMVYSTKGMPTNVKVTWDKFNEVLKTVDSVVFAFDEVQQAEFSMFLDNNTFEWNAADRKPPPPITNVTADADQLSGTMMTVPVASVALLGLALLCILAMLFSSQSRWLAAATVTLLLASIFLSRSLDHDVPNPFAEPPQIAENEASEIFEQLHRNMFRAFDYHNESQIYDALAHSVEGDLLRKLYLQINDSLRVAEQGGAISHVEEVRILDGQRVNEEPVNADGHLAFQYRSQWELRGTVEHWGHIHERKNRYDASFQVELVGDDWKITDMQVNDFSHGAVKTRVRKL